jgi:hypothetical protein
MKVYAVRKRRGLWAVCSDENVVLQFESYDEAVGTAQSAADVLNASSHPPSENGGGPPPNNSDAPARKP